MTEILELYRGDTFLLSGCSYSVDGIKQPLENIQISSTVIDIADAKVFDCVIAKGLPDDQGHIYGFDVKVESAVTKAAKTGKHTGIIHYDWPTFSISAPVFILHILPSPLFPE